MLIERLEVERAAESDDEALAIRAKSDREAFGVLYDRYLNRVYSFCRRRLATPEEAEDATSIIFTRALTALPRYQVREAPFAAWIFSIARNVVIDQSRLTARRRQIPWRCEIDVSMGPEESAVATEAAAELRKMLRTLSSDQAEAVHLRLAGLNDKEIAFVLGRSHGAIRIAQHRAIKRLRALFETNDPGTEDD